MEGGKGGAALPSFLPSFLHSRLVNSNEKSAVTDDDDDDDDDDDVEEMQAAELMSDPRMRIHEGGREGGRGTRPDGRTARVGVQLLLLNLLLVEESGAVTKFGNRVPYTEGDWSLPIPLSCMCTGGASGAAGAREEEFQLMASHSAHTERRGRAAARLS